MFNVFNSNYGGWAWLAVWHSGDMFVSSDVVAYCWVLLIRGCVHCLPDPATQVDLSFYQPWDGKMSNEYQLSGISKIVMVDVADSSLQDRWSYRPSLVLLVRGLVVA